MTGNGLCEGTELEVAAAAYDLYSGKSMSSNI